MGANRHTTGGFDKHRCDAFDAQASAKLRGCEDALTALKAGTPNNQEKVAVTMRDWDWATSFNDTTAMHSAAIVASVAGYLDRVTIFYRTLAATRSTSVETIGRLSLPAPLKPTLRRRPASSCLGLTASASASAEDDQSADRLAVEEARLSQRHARRAVEQSKRIELLVLDPSDRTALHHEMHHELEGVEAELIAAIRTVDKLTARRSRQRSNGTDADLAEAAARLSTSLRRDRAQLKSALDGSPRRLIRYKKKDAAAVAAASDKAGHSETGATTREEPSVVGSDDEDDNITANSLDEQQPEEGTKSDADHSTKRSDGSAVRGTATTAGSSSAGKKKILGATSSARALHRDREARINASLQCAVDNPSYSDSLTSKQLETEQATLMAQRAREDDLSTALLSARQKLEAIAEQRTKLAQHVVTQNETLVRTLKDTDDAKDDIASGNDEVKKASTSQNDMRWGVVFFLLMCSVCLLFLEWEGRR